MLSLLWKANVHMILLSTVGNKGASAIGFNIDGTSLCFLSSHLAANRERTARWVPSNMVVHFYL